MVSISPQYRGLNLAKPLNAAVLKYLVNHQRNIVTLDTDDVRLPAIKVYISLGFLPVLFDDGMYERWQHITKHLGITIMHQHLELPFHKEPF